MYDTIRSTFMEDLDKLLGGSFEEFSALNTSEKTGFVLGCENGKDMILRLYYG